MNSLVGCWCVMRCDEVLLPMAVGVGTRVAGERHGAIVLSVAACVGVVDLVRLFALIACPNPKSSGGRLNALHTWSSVPSCGTCNPRSHRLKVLTLTPAFSLATAMLHRLRILAASSFSFGIAIFPS